MDFLGQRMPYVTAFSKALGTGMVISADSPIDDKVRSAMESLIEDYEHVLSRFRNDSLIAAIGKAEHGGSFDFPDWCAPLFDLYDALFSATSGAIDPCVGEDLIRLGYDASLSFTVTQDAPEHLGALRGRAVWGRDATRHGTTLVTHEPVQLDFGACGKGYLVDLLGRMLRSTQFVIDAGGDLLIHAEQPISVALEDPEDSSRAIGVAHIVMVHCAQAHPADAIGTWQSTSAPKSPFIICSMPSTDCPRNKPKPAGHTFQQTQRPTLRATTPPPSRTAWPQPCSFPTQRNCSARSISHTQH